MLALLVGGAAPFIAGPLHAQPFEATSFDLTGVMYSSSSWGDYDGDGDLDLLVTGNSSGDTPTAKIYRNLGTTAFVEVAAGLAGVKNSSSSWGDYDGDGDLDLVVTGSDGSERTATIYRNDGGGTFTDIEAGLTGVTSSSSSWGDYDGDGNLDLAVTGFDAEGESATIYRNDGDGTFTDIGAGLVGVSNGSSSWGDYDGDGDLDLVITGRTTGLVETATLYRNDGDGTFTDVPAGLTGVSFSSSSWGDYDGDGDPDLVVSGGWDQPEESATIIYRNDGGGVFTDIGADLPPGVSGSASWGDYDGDGDLDLVITGFDSGTTTAAIYRNDGDGAFTDIEAGLTAVGSSSAAWGDYDGDGDLDLVITGADECCNPVSRTATIYENTGTNANAAPDAPTGLTATVVNAENGTVSLSWAVATDNPSVPGGETAPQDALTYNVRLGTAPGAGDVVAPHAITEGYNPGGATEGTRLVPARGNAGHRTSLTVTGLEEGQTYYWSVQAVDPGLAASSFATEATIADDALPVELVSLDAVARAGTVTLRWQTASETGNAGFAVEARSDSAAAWTELGFIEGTGTANEAQTYRFEAEGLAPGTHAFRLRQVDLDGTARATAPITATVGLEGRYHVQAYPNPIAQQATVEVAVRTKQTVTVDVYDAAGRRVATLYDGTLPASETKRLTLDAGQWGLASGLYLVRLTGEGFATTERLTVVR